MAGITIKDLARIAQVHPSTISLALSDSPRLPEATRRRLQDLAAKHHYRPNAAARWLRQGRTGTIALVLWQEAEAQRLGRVQRQLLTAVGTATAQDYQVLVIAATQERLAREPVDTIVSRAPVDGALFMGQTADRQGLRRLIQSGFPVVHYGQRVLADTDLAYVSADYRGGARTGVTHLTSLGHERIALLGDPRPPAEVIWERIEGYREALVAADLPLDPDLEISGESGNTTHLVDRLRSVRATALFTVSARVALDALRACQKAGIDVPGDLSLVAFDDCEEFTQADLPVTAIRQPDDEIAADATRLLLRLIDGDTLTGAERHQLLETNLIVRQSTAPRPPRA